MRGPEQKLGRDGRSTGTPRSLKAWNGVNNTDKVIVVVRVIIVMTIIIRSVRTATILTIVIRITII